MKQVSLREPRSKALRLWHWGSFIIVCLMLFTVFTGKFFVNPYGNSRVIHQALISAGASVTEEQAAQAAERMSEKVWALHTKFGYVLAGLFVFRILIEVLQSRKQRFFPALIDAIRQFNRPDRGQARHYVLVKTIYLLFYGLLGTIVWTGLWMAFNIDLKQKDGERFHATKEIHEQCFFLLLVFIVVHLAGVIIAERRRNKGIVSGMINGDKELLV